MIAKQPMPRVGADEPVASPLEMINVEKRFGPVEVLKGVQLSLKPGSITGLLGRNASGKTTLMRAAVGLLKPEKGVSLLFGANAFDSPAEVRQRVGYVSQSHAELAFLQVNDALELIGSFYPTWDHGLVEQFRIQWNVPKRGQIGKLSLGQQQKVGILLGIGHRPDLLILDEPVASLDPAARQDFVRTLLQMNAETNQTILFSSHIMTDIERVAADVAILHQGRISYHGDLDELKERVNCLYLRTQRASEVSGAQQQAAIRQRLQQIGGMISSRMDGQRMQIWVKDWDAQKEAQLSDACGVIVQSERVGLEELFLGMTT